MQPAEDPNRAQHTAADGQPAQEQDAAAVSRSFGLERRRHGRRDVINQQLVPFNLGNDNGGLILNLSRGGAAVQAVSPIQLAASSTFVFHLPDIRSPIEGSGVCVWVDKTGLHGGLRFDSLSPQSQRLLRHWLGDGQQGETTEALPSQRFSRVMEVGALGMVVTRAKPVATSFGVRAPALAAELKWIAEQACILTMADGAGVAIRDGTAFVYEASVGTAPDTGTVLSPNLGVLAECAATRGFAVCNNAEGDPRLDPLTSQQLRPGSMALTPLFKGHALVGVLAVFSDRAHLFGADEVRRLQDLAGVLEAGLLGDLQPEAEPASVSVGAGRRGSRQDIVAMPKRTMSQPNRARGAAWRKFTSVVLGSALLYGGWMPMARYFESSAPQVSQAMPVQVTSPPSSQSKSAGRPPARPKKEGSRQTISVRNAEVRQASLVRPEGTAQHMPSPANSAVLPTPARTKRFHIELSTAVLGTEPSLSATMLSRLSPPELISRTEISYPPAALAKNVEGSVVVRTTVDRSGMVSLVQMLNGDPAFASAALRAISQWGYKPYKPAGRAVEVQLLITVNFVLSQ